MEKTKNWLQGFFILSIIALSFTLFTSIASAKDSTLFYEDKSGEECQNCILSLYTNGTFTYQLFQDTINYGDLIKLNVLDNKGNKLGSYKFEENSFLDFRTSDPTIDKDGNIYISYHLEHGFGSIGAYTLASISSSGKLNWKFTDFDRGYGPSTPIFGTDGTIYFGTGNLSENIGPWGESKVYALNSNGTKKWDVKVEGDGAWGKLSFDGQQQLLISPHFYEEPFFQYTISTKNGEIVNTEQIKSFYRHFDNNGNEYYLNDFYDENHKYNALLIAVDKKGEELWSYPFEGDLMIHTVRDDGTVYLTKSPWVEKNSTLSISQGKLNWEKPGLPFDLINRFYLINQTKVNDKSVTTISELDEINGNEISRKTLNFGYTVDYYFKTNYTQSDDGYMLFPVGNDIYKVTLQGGKQSGWERDDGKWYFYKDGVIQRGWIQDKGTWYYADSNGVMKTGWYKVSNKWYYSTPSGAMQTGWIKLSNKWYYLSSSGAMESGWVKLNNTWYFLNDSGAMQSGWFKAGTTWHYANSSGAMQTGWTEVNSTWYFLDNSGAMKTNWLQQGGKWYFLNNSGAMQTGWQLINNKHYYFYSNGQMAANTTVGGYKLDKSGSWWCDKPFF